MRVVVSEFMPASGLDLLREGAQVQYDPHLAQSPVRLREAVALADALVVRNRTRVDAALLDAAPHLRVVGRLGAGLDNLDQVALDRRAIRLVHARGLNATAAAEFTIGLALALQRTFDPSWWSGPGPDWSQRGQRLGRELAGKTLGLVGLGAVGAAVAQRARALGLRVLAAGGPGTAASATALGIPLVELPALLAASDVVSLHCRLTPDTHRMVDGRTLAMFRPWAVLINTARGGLVDEAALDAALRSGRLAGAALDVRDPEPPPAPDPLEATPHLLRSPHLAGLTLEAQEQIAASVAGGVLSALRELAGECGGPILPPAPDGAWAR